MDHQAIIETFYRIEQESGELANADPKQTLKRTAKECGVSIEVARAVMIDHWTMRGGG